MIVRGDDRRRRWEVAMTEEHASDVDQPGEVSQELRDMFASAAADLDGDEEIEDEVEP
jgi:hypothetical protein